jgi:predicted dienelactone hydrolase
MPGFRLIEVPADARGQALDGAIWHPCAEPPGEIELGLITALFGITLRAAEDCLIAGDNLPLIILSHGRCSHFVIHHDIAETLADAGFVVATINHPGDTYLDMSRSGDLSAFVDRPGDIKRLVDFMLVGSPAASNIDPGRIGFFGFSRGGYTGLVLAGADPDWANAGEFCRQSSARWCEQIRRREFPARRLEHDVRIKAAVIADPLAVFFTANNLTPVTVPVQLWASEFGGDGVSLESIAAVDRSLPAEHEYHVVSNGGHFAFLIPCPLALAQAVPEIATDPPGFDRVAFHKEFNASVLAFFRAELGGL